MRAGAISLRLVSDPLHHIPPIDRPALKALPDAPYVYAEWKQCRAGLDYHVDIGRHYYSVPHQLLTWRRI